VQERMSAGCVEYEALRVYLRGDEEPAGGKRMS